jgi:hypothetical protein
MLFFKINGAAENDFFKKGSRKTTYPPIAQIALERRLTAISRQVLIQHKDTNLRPNLSRKIGLTAPGLGNCRARCSARCHAPCSSPRLRSGSSRGCGWRRIHPLPLICPPPAGGRPLYLMILPPLALRHYTKVEPAGSGPAASFLSLPRATRPATWRWWRTLRTRPVVPSSRMLRCHKDEGSRIGNRSR